MSVAQTLVYLDNEIKAIKKQLKRKYRTEYCGVVMLLTIEDENQIRMLMEDKIMELQELDDKIEYYCSRIQGGSLVDKSLTDTQKSRRDLYKATKLLVRNWYASRSSR